MNDNSPIYIEIQIYTEIETEDLNEDVLFELFKDELLSSSMEFDGPLDRICGEIALTLSSEGGSPDVDDLEIEGFSFDEESLTGEFILNYTVNRIFTCSDLNSHDRSYLEFEFVFDLPNQTFKCSSINNFSQFSPE
ncbi:hypothetical protein SMI01S_11890 [Sphingobacterium mizutaii NBRC 14946 = DSM 11724]|uniref:Uncharacterized protein n=2 Tax=Sphingobacterium mizutaii TaxID=1010 RepID=A0AAJ4XCM8_9SPHI|nr:hypothetical protein [Sphingobacterium mizutaii]GEM67583.1 hypothetical protein SMI01S_11890 [Sphingobacterium mizutaii NBRC 14946 = DSM 11724]SDL14673.1 hypothetical protein SAMN05192578_1011522 [Sphingobacterium mizutaii]SNV52196.1 Uncharacterised protein [Sphingobacterium mizutaii]